MRILTWLLILVFVIVSCGTETDSTYSIIVTATPEEGGEVDPAQGEFDKGVDARITATPHTGYIFKKWEGDYSGSDNPLTLNMDEDKLINAVFEKRSYPLTINIQGEGKVVEEVLQAKTDYEHGTQVQLTSIPEDGWRFVEWKEDILGAENPSHITIASEKNVTAIFKSKKYVKTISGNEYDKGLSITATNDGGFIVTGSTNSTEGDFSGLNRGGSDIFLLKVDGQFHTEWLKTYGGSSDEEGRSVLQTQDGGYIITGYTGSDDGDFDDMLLGNHIIFVMKTDPVGKIQWLKTYGGPAWEYGSSITKSTDGGYVITGYTGSNNLDFTDLRKGRNTIYLLKINDYGKKEWIKTFGGDGNNYGESVITTPDGGYLIAARSNANDGDFEGLDYAVPMMILIKTNHKGEKEWIKGYGGSDSQFAEQTINTSDGGFMIVGGSNSVDGDFAGINSEDGNMFLLKTDSEGNIEWVHTYGGGDSDTGKSVTMTEDGGYIITGKTDSANGDIVPTVNPIHNLPVIKVDSNGDVIWSKIFWGNHWEEGVSIAHSPMGGYALTGHTSSDDGDFSGHDPGNNSIILIKIDENGDLYTDSGG